MPLLVSVSRPSHPSAPWWIAHLLVAILLLGLNIDMVRAQDPVLVVPHIEAAPQVLTIASPTFQAPFTVAPRNRNVFTVTLDASGTLYARATWSEGGRIALILNGPGQSRPYARKRGVSPLSIAFDVTDELLDQGATWKISVVRAFPGRPANGTLSVNVPRPSVPAEDEPSTSSSPSSFANIITDRTDLIEIAGPNYFDTLQEVAPGLASIDRPELLENGSLQFDLPNGLIGQLSPSDTLTIVDPEHPDSTQTMVLRYTAVQTIDPPDPPEELLSATGDLNAWWGLMQVWMNGMNERMRLSLEQVFSPTEMERFTSLEADVGLDSPFERADYRLRYLEYTLLGLIPQTAGEDANSPPPNQ